MKMKRFVVLACVLAMLLSLAGCSPEAKIVGTWRNQNNIMGVVTETVYEFKEDGTGTMSTVLGVSLAITYTIDDTYLTISTTTLGITNEEVYTYSFDGDTLTLVGDDGTFTLEKQE